MPPSTPSSPPAAATHTLRLDRIEADQAILEVVGGGLLEIPAGLLPAGTREGSVLTLTLALAPAETETLRAEAEARLARLKASSPPKKILDL